MPNKDDIKKLLQIEHRKLQKLKEQQAKIGVLTPHHILTDMEDTEANINRLEAQLENPEFVEIVIQPLNKKFRKFVIIGSILSLILLLAILMRLNYKNEAILPTKSSIDKLSPSIDEDEVEISLQLPPDSVPTEIEIMTESGLTVFVLKIAPGTTQKINLPPGNYKYAIVTREFAYHTYLTDCEPSLEDCTQLDKRIIYTENFTVNMSEKNFLKLPKIPSSR